MVKRTRGVLVFAVVAFVLAVTSTFFGVDASGVASRVTDWVLLAGAIALGLFGGLWLDRQFSKGRERSDQGSSDLT